MFLDVKGLSVYYDKVSALRNVSLYAEKGTIVALIGANGAGKTTFLKTVSGVKRATSGEIWFDGKRIDRTATHDIVALGIGLTPEGRRLFRLMTVKENLAMGAFLRKNRAEVEADIEDMFRHFPILKERQNQLAKTLSGGEGQMLAIARALMTKPRLLLMDEPSLGLAPLVVAEIARIIETIKTIMEITVVLVEQNAHMALKLADKGYVIETGNIVMSDSGAALLNNERVRKAYLGA